MKSIVLTGVTGIIGREVIYELLSNPAYHHKFDKIICLIRKSKQLSAKERMDAILTHPAAPHTFTKLDLNKAKEKLEVIDCYGNQEDDYSEVVEYLKRNASQKAKVMHLASTTNLSPLAVTEEEIYKNSYLPTFDLLTALLPHIDQFSFISTSFSCGHQQGLIPNEYSRLTVKSHRNYYERWKLIAERRVGKICMENGVGWQVLRPGTVCGRLLDHPFYFTPKFNVFYAFAGFFYSMKQNGIDTTGIRIKMNPKSGLNIIPSDYAAKALVRAFFDNSIKELNVVHSAGFVNSRLIPSILDLIGVKDYVFQDDIPTNHTLAEKMYYKTAGIQFTPYIHTYEHQYDTTKLRELMQDIAEPDVPGNFTDILQFAVEKKFADEKL